MTITQEQIEADKALCDRATVGPWEYDPVLDGMIESSSGGAIASIARHASSRTVIDTGEEYSSADAAFIARARTALPEYIAELEALRARHKALFKLATKILDTEQHSGRPYSDDRLVPGGPIRELRKLVRGEK